MNDGSHTQANDCACCAGVAVKTPAELGNRPGLTALAYRAGTYATIKQSLLARLSDAQWPMLGKLRSREPDDFTIALLDAVAVVGDVLTFYQERIANESFLRTASERLSILEQARLIGYQWRPVWPPARTSLLPWRIPRRARTGGETIDSADRHESAERSWTR